MARLPVVGGDAGAWGTILNTYLSQSINTDGTIPTSTQTLLVSASNAQASTINRADYKCTGTNDHTLINTAISALGSVGGTVILSEGTFSLGGTISVVANVNILGCGWNTIISIPNSTNIYAITFPNVASAIVGVRVERLKINCNGANQTGGGGIHAYSGVHCFFDSLYITTPYDKGLWLDGSLFFGHHNKMTRCLVDHGASSSGQGVGLYINNCDENYICQNDFETCGGTIPYAIDDTNGLNMYDNNVFVNGGGGMLINNTNKCQIRGNIFDSVGGDCINGSFTKTLIQNNTFYNIGNAVGANTGSGINLTFGNISNSIIGNYFDSNTTNGNTRSFIREQNSGSPTGNIYAENIFTVIGNMGTSVTEGLLTNTGDIVRHNIGLVTEASGTATLLSGNTTIVVTHGLGYTPLIQDILVLPQVDINPVGQIWVSTITSTQFTININMAASSNIAITWNIRKV